MVGWQNATALEQLSSPAKKAINELQKQHGFAITDFEQLPDLRRLHDEWIAIATKQHGMESFLMRRKETDVSISSQE